MNRSEILNSLQEIFQDVLDNEDIVVSETSNAGEIEEWDSLANVQLIVAIEREFGIRFTSAEIPSWKNVGDMIDCIMTKI